MQTSTYSPVMILTQTKFRYVEIGRTSDVPGTIIDCDAEARSSPQRLNAYDWAQTS